MVLELRVSKVRLFFLPLLAQTFLFLSSFPAIIIDEQGQVNVSTCAKQQNAWQCLQDSLPLFHVK